MSTANSNLNNYRIQWLDIDANGEHSNGDNYIVQTRSNKYFLKIIIDILPLLIVLMITVGFTIFFSNGYIGAGDYQVEEYRPIIMKFLYWSIVVILLFLALILVNSMMNHGWSNIDENQKYLIFKTQDEAVAKMNDLVSKDNIRFKISNTKPKNPK